MADSTCPHCGNLVRSGELVCLGCGALLGPGFTTVPLKDMPEPESPRAAGIGALPDTSKQTITLEIGPEKIVLPSKNTISLGRIVPSEQDNNPCDVDLAPFGASVKGISRKHALILRKNGLFYVTDLNSTNGTRLNGQRLMPNVERLLRSGDELKLGTMVVAVRF